MEFTTVRDVELLSVGMRWRSVNGDITFTFEHLADAARAANEDPHIVPPRLKIGHSDPRFEDPNDPGHDPFFDGEPALGSVRNLRLENDGSMLVGDYVDVPVWLAEVMPTAYPSRSIEGAWSTKEGAAGEVEGTWDVTTPGGKHYSFVLTACALLGLSRPAVENLDDLRRYLVEGQGVVVAGAAPPGGQPVAASIGDVPLIPEMSADVERVVDVFCADFAPGPNDEGYWWWPISMFTESGVLYCDDDEGGIRAIPYTTDDDQNVSFGEPYRVIQRYEAAPATAALASSLQPGHKPAVVFRSVAETPLAARHAGREKPGDREGSPASGNLGHMDLTDAQRSRLAAKLGLAEDADETAITEALDTEEEAPEEVPAPEVSAATVTVDKAVWDATHAKAEMGERALLRQQDEDRKAILSAAVKAGKIMPSSKADWEKKLLAAPEATKKEIESLAEGLVPVTESGGSPAPDASTANADADAVTAAWFGISNPTREAA